MKKKNVTLEESLETLVHFAVERNDIKQLINGLPEKDDINSVTMEYELQLLQILTVGWGISYFLENVPEKKVVLEMFWNRINALSKTISKTLTPSLGSEFDYFFILKQRLDLYVKAIERDSETTDPGIKIGPLFAGLCGDESHDYLILSGKAAFHLSLGDVKRYFESVVICIEQ
jgi:hypothetical protein